ncbi:MAG: glycosyltransferase [Candidatus Eiseniibacteriota bacterium]
METARHAVTDQPSLRRRAFVLGALIPAGGAYMAYHLGLILHEVFGFECLVLDIDAGFPDREIFEYPKRFSRLPWEAAGAMATSEDLLIANPSFSHLLLGMTFPGTKLTYIQHFSTYDVLDCFFDHYVSVSDVVRDHVRRLYDLDTPVIPPFIHTELVPEPVPWDVRPAGKVLVLRKSHSAAFLEHVKALLQERHPQLRLEFEPVGGVRRHRDLFAPMQAYRYVLSLSGSEGFGLMPLEAMLCGCAVVGFHAHGGKQYMVAGRNCEVVGYPDFDGLVDGLARVATDDGHARGIAAAGRQTALGFGIGPFRERWTAFFEESMKLTRPAGTVSRAAGPGFP